MAGASGRRMICADSSSFIAFTQGEPERDVELVAQALAQRLLVLSPVTASELLSDPNLAPSIEASVLEVPTLEITRGYWERAGKLRALLMARQLRPKIADTLIAQSCLDHQVPLITRVRDFAAFQKHAGLSVLLAK